MTTAASAKPTATTRTTGSPTSKRSTTPRTCSTTTRTSALVERRLGFPSQRGDILLRERSSPMGETRRKFDRDFREGAVRLVRETGKPVAQVARDLGVNEGTLGNWVNADRRRRDGSGGAPGEGGAGAAGPP